MLIELTEEEKRMIIIGLQMRRNYITTGTPHLSLDDLAKFRPDSFKEHGAEIKTLSTDQMEFCVKTDHLIGKLFTNILKGPTQQII